MVKKLFDQAIFFFPLQLFLVGVAYADSGPALSKSVLISGETRIFEDNRGIQIHVENQPLNKVLMKIQDMSGIQFQLNDEMKKFPFAANIKASDWETAIGKMLKGMKCSISVDSYVNLGLFIGEMGDEQGAKRYSEKTAYI